MRMLLASALAAAALAPSAITGPATGVTATGATLHGSVDDVTAYYFQFGTTTSYGATTEPQPVTDGPAPVPVQAAVGTLTGNTTYHYRVVGTTGGVPVAVGEDLTFTTAPNPTPPGVANQHSRSITPTTATVSATVDANGSSTTYYFQYGTSTRYGARTPEATVEGSNAVTVTAGLSGLRAYTRHHWRLVATNAAGTSRGRDRTFTTARLPTGVTLALSRRTVTWGRGLSLGGRVSGAGSSGMTVALEQQGFPYDRPFSQVRTTRTGRDGGYLFSIDNLRITTRYRVVTRTQAVATSPTVTARSAVRPGISVRNVSRRRARIEGTIAPAVTGTVVLQRRRRTGGWFQVRTATVAPFDAKSTRYRFGVWRVRKLSRRYRVVVRPAAGAHVRARTRSVWVSRRPARARGRRAAAG